MAGPDNVASSLNAEKSPVTAATTVPLPNAPPSYESASAAPLPPTAAPEPLQPASTLQPSSTADVSKESTVSPMTTIHPGTWNEAHSRETNPSDSIQSQPDPEKGLQSPAQQPILDEKKQDHNDSVKPQPQVSKARNTVPLNSLMALPSPVHCPCCGAETVTITNAVSGDHTSMMALLACCIGGFLLVWIPFAMRDCKDIEHMCGNCGNKLCKWHRNNGTTIVYV